jgi:phosphoribosylamine--glycine ligase
VVKADWLAAGKGVVVPHTHDEAADAVRALLDGATAGASLVLEERLVGREVSVFALVSDEAVVPLGAARDYKRLRDGDAGPNTGGMGAYAPVPWFGPREVEDTLATVFEPIAWRMARDGTPYRGVLYAGLMLTEAGPMVLEFNARFGDPEAQVLLPLLEGDLAAALRGTAAVDRAAMESVALATDRAAVGIVLAAEGYPEAPLTERPLRGVDPSAPGDDGPQLCFHAGTRRAGDGHVSTGGRVVTFVGIGPDHAVARERAMAGVTAAGLEGGQHRSDVGAEVAS